MIKKLVCMKPEMRSLLHASIDSLLTLNQLGAWDGKPYFGMIILVLLVKIFKRNGTA